ncbi:hypothetical protein CHRY9293_03643 [Chryseobacterium potabilaquae]|uniref:Uncharacterized protein n=1 Tax=Chryseobacterium potabilaquae TaxID=2675057 RepID=A0A6N4X928_9FLAO|nr:hypothetical protein CHRY9293_03643 [Chryseobacterium potabilaquae]
MNLNITKLITKRSSLIFSTFIISIYPIQAQTLTVSGTNWAVSIPSITEAGTNYTGTYESATNQVILTASVPLLLGNGKVSVHYEPNPTWNTSLILSAKRTNNGSTICALCTITGGTTYQTVTQTDIELFRIQAVLALASYTGINIQLQLSGVSVTIPATTYNSKVVFTISAI